MFKKVLFLILLFCKVVVFSQQGNFFVRNFLPKHYEHSPNNNGMVQDDYGNIFIANNNGVILFNGIDFQLIKRVDEPTVYSVGKTKTGQIVCGTEDGDIALLKKNLKGVYVYQSLFNSSNLQFQPQKEVRQIINYDGKTYFLSSDKLVEYDDKSLKFYSPKTKFGSRAFVINNYLCLADIENGLKLFKDGKFISILNSEHLSSLKNFICYSPNKLKSYIGNREEGFYELRFNFNNPSNSVIKRYPCDLDNFLTTAEINNGTLLNNNNFVITSNKLGALLIDSSLKIIDRYNSKTGLPDDNIKHCYQDVNGSLWFSNYYGFSFIDFNSPLRKYDRANGITGLVQSTAFFKNNLIIATDKSLQYFDNELNSFKLYNNFNHQVFNLSIYNNILFVASQKGLFVEINNRFEQISETTSYFTINDVYNKSVIYCGREGGVDVYFTDKNKVIFLKTYNLDADVRSMCVDNNKNIYFATANKGIYYLNFFHSYLLDSIKQKEGLPKEQFENNVFTFKNKLFIATDSGIYTVKKQNTRFVCVEEKYYNNVIGKILIPRAIQFGNDLLCSEKREDPLLKKEIKRVALYKQTDKGIKDYSYMYSKLKDLQINQFYYDSLSKLMCVSANEGLFLITNSDIQRRKSYNLSLGLVKAVNDTLSMNVVDSIYQNTNSISYKNNSLRITLGFTNFENENFDFSYKLIGRDDNFTNWSNEHIIKLENLTENNYELVIKAKSESTNNIYSVKYRFTILPPFYRTWWAYVIYGVLFLSIIFIAIKLNSKRLIAQNLKLEETIKQRTAIIEEQKKLVEHKHKEITDSINYAERIQRSFLASKELLNKNLKDYFILFKPKDIVSGDFYWATEITDDKLHSSNSKFLLCTADSTGHGVPGAIMSLLNITSIESAVKEGFIKPDEVLNHTRNTIIERLKKDGSADGGKDGMDCSLLYFDFLTMKLQIASANNPVWIVKNSGTDSIEVQEIKPDKMPVGKHDKDKQAFALNEVILQKGDIIYTLTDGFPDQFGGEKGKKFMSKNLRELLTKNAHLSMQKQKELLETTFNKWKGNNEQIDDVTVVGIKI